MDLSFTSLCNSTYINLEQAEVIKKVKEAAIKNIWETCQNIDRYGIDSTTEKGQQTLIEIAKIALDNGRDPALLKNFHKFNIRSEDARIDIAKTIVKRNLLGFLVNSESFKINFDLGEGEKFLEVLVEEVTKNGYEMELAKNVQKLAVKSEKLKIRLAKVVARKNPHEFCENIENFELDFNTEKGQKALKKVIFILQEKGREAVISKNFLKFQVQSEKVRVELAKMLAMTDGSAVTEHIKNYEISPNTEIGKKALKEIIEIALQKGYVKAVSQNIQNFDIYSTKAKIKIIKAALEKNVNDLFENIVNFNVDFNKEEYQKDFDEIIKIVIKKRDGKAISKNIQKFGIVSDMLRIKIAKMVAEQDPKMLSVHIKNYEIDPSKYQDSLIEIAKIAARNDGGNTSEFIKNFQIDSNVPKGKKALLEIAKIAMKTNIQKTLLFIKDYGIDPHTPEGQKALVKLAKISAAFSGGKTSKYLKSFMIESTSCHGKKALVEIAKIAAAKSGSGTLEYIQNYEIDTAIEQGKKDLTDIIGIALKQNVIKTTKFLKHHISNYFIFDVIPTCDLANDFNDAIISQLPTFTFHMFNKRAKAFKTFYNLTEQRQLLKLSKGNLLDNILMDFKEFCQMKQSPFPPSFISWLNQSYTLIKKERAKRKFLEWIIVLTQFSLLTGQSHFWMENTQLLSAIRKTSPWLRDMLTKELFYFYRDFDQKKDYLQVFKNKCSKEKKEPPIHTEIPALIFAGYSEELHDVCLDAIKKIKHKREFYRREENNKNLLETLLKIKNSDLSINEKKCILKELFLLGDKDHLRACKLVKNLIVFEELTYFEYLEKNAPSEKGLIKDLENSVKVFFKKKFQSEVKHFGEKYVNTFEKWRNLDLLITFAGKMNSLEGLEKEEALSSLKEFITSVLNNDFQTKRYETCNNPHLLQIKKTSPEIFEKWQENITLDPSEKVVQDKDENHLISDGIKNEILEGLQKKHLGEKELYPHLTQFLSDSSCYDTYIKSISDDLESLEQKRNASDDKTMSREEIKSRKRLFIEKNILELLVSNDIAVLEEKLKILITQIPKSNEFRKVNLGACLNLLTANSLKNTDFIVVESDHPNDHLLVGSEVKGSCLNVNESPYFNKCILGYAWDGKHKLLLIKNLQDKILARAVLRILVDKNGHPVLFMEQVYTSDDNDSLYVSNIVNLALKKAKYLGIPLLTTDQSHGETRKVFSSPIFAGKKPTSFEYVDTLGSIEQGPYSIQNVYEIME